MAKLKLISVRETISTALGSSLDHACIVTAALVEPDHRKKCQYCGNQHVTGRQFCLAAGQYCETCDRFDHMAKVCRSSKTHSVTIENKILHKKTTFFNEIKDKKEVSIEK